ncbi:unnamed protein product [Choristocarpus tenellus]
MVRGNVHVSMQVAFVLLQDVLSVILSSRNELEATDSTNWYVPPSSSTFSNVCKPVLVKKVAKLVDENRGLRRRLDKYEGIPPRGKSCSTGVSMKQEVVGTPVKEEMDRAPKVVLLKDRGYGNMASCINSSESAVFTATCGRYPSPSGSSDTTPVPPLVPVHVPSKLSVSSHTSNSKEATTVHPALNLVKREGEEVDVMTVEDSISSVDEAFESASVTDSSLTSGEEDDSCDDLLFNLLTGEDDDGFLSLLGSELNSSNPMQLAFSCDQMVKEELVY